MLTFSSSSSSVVVSAAAAAAAAATTTTRRCFFRSSYSSYLSSSFSSSSSSSIKNNPSNNPNPNGMLKRNKAMMTASATASSCSYSSSYSPSSFVASTDRSSSVMFSSSSSSSSSSSPSSASFSLIMMRTTTMRTTTMMRPRNHENNKNMIKTTSPNSPTSRNLMTTTAFLAIKYKIPTTSGGARRTKMTKTKKRRMEKKARKAELAAKGIFPPKPPNYIDPKEPVINALSRKERNDRAREAEQIATDQLAHRMTEIETRDAKLTVSRDHAFIASTSGSGSNNEGGGTMMGGPHSLRFHMGETAGSTDHNDLITVHMSDRVRKLFDLTNGNQTEVIKAQKQKGMELFQLREGDTGSSAVQVIALTTRIQQLQTHLRMHRKDHSTKRGLDALYVRRRKLLDYMERKDFESYRRVVKTLGLNRN